MGGGILTRPRLDREVDARFNLAMYYQVEGTNLRVLGTMHAFPVENINMPSWIWDGFDWCEVLFFEAPDWQSDPDAESVAKLPQGTTLKKLVTPKLWRQLNALVTDKQKLTFLKPWVLMVSIETLMFYLKDGVEPQFRQRLAKCPKQVAYLETTRNAAKAFETVPYRVYLKMLEFTLDNPIQRKKASFDFYNAWVEGRIADFKNCLNNDPMSSLFPTSGQGMTIARNKNWMASFKSAFSSSRKTLFVVGAGHLFGDGGLEQLLAKEGHPLVPLIT